MVRTGKPTPRTKYSLHVTEYKDCKECELHETRKHMVFAKGRIPCDILFIGEAPGKSEDILGEPFVGPAGHLLDHIIDNSVDKKYRVAFTNMVCCIPIDKEDMTKFSEPPEESVKACKPRLEDFIAICNPKLIVCVGKLAWNWCQPSYKHSIKMNRSILITQVMHPAAVLRTPVTHQGLEIQKCIINIRSAIEDLEKIVD